MSTKKHPENIPASIEELVNTALNEADDDVAWAAVNALHALGTRDVLKVAQRLCGMTGHRERRLGCDILGQLGVQIGKPSKAFPEECVVALLDTLRGEFHPAVLNSLFVALSHQGDERAISAAAQHKDHPDANVRHAVVLALSGHDTEKAIAMLGKLTTDPSPEVRDWATFGLGSQIEADSPSIRDALAERLADSDADTRGEALLGLARRGDSRAVDAIRMGEKPFTETGHFAEAKIVLEENEVI